jgi:hypothetical protein
MPTVTKIEESRKRVQEAAEAAMHPVKSASSGAKAAREASQAGGEAVRNAMEATGNEARKTVDAAEQNLQQAADTMRGTVERSVETVDDAAGAAREASGETLASINQMSAFQDRVYRDVTDRTQQNLGVMMRTGIKLADGFQAVLREWADYTRNAMQCNIDGMNSILRARSPQDLLAAQSELLNQEIRLMLTSSIKIAEATARAANEASQCIGQPAQK